MAIRRPNLIRLLVNQKKSGTLNLGFPLLFGIAIREEIRIVEVEIVQSIICGVIFLVAANLLNSLDKVAFILATALETSTNSQ
jgi:hypothetical protein